MLELPKDYFARLMPLFDTTQPNATMIFSTLAGHTLGRAFVNDLTQPTNCLLVMDFQHFSFTHANVNQQWLNETAAALRGHFGFFLNWPEHFAERLQPPPDFARAYVGHEFMSYTPQGDLPLPTNRHFRMMDAELLGRAAWRDLMLQAFGTAEHFLANGLGVCVMDGEEICSEAYAAFLGAGKVEIGIVTNEKYRQQGNAYLACKRLTQVLEERGDPPPHWSYFENNVGSAATARKLGFGDERHYRWYHYPQVT